MSSFIDDLLLESKEGTREHVRARLRVMVTEGLLTHMERSGVSKNELAQRIGVSRSAISQALSETRNLSLNTLADMADALGLVPEVAFQSKVIAQRHATVNWIQATSPVSAARSVDVPATTIGTQYFGTIRLEPKMAHAEEFLKAG